MTEIKFPRQYGQRHLPGAVFSQCASTQKLSKIHLADVPGRRKRPIPVPPHVAATYVSISKTCPSTCVFKDNGCFAQNGFIRRFTRPLDEQAMALDPLEVTRNEVRLIDRSFGGKRIPQDGKFGGRDLRLHVGGDVPSEEGARLLAAAAQRWKRRGGGEIWTFTHRWREIPSGAWGVIHVWASTETAAEAKEAMARGYRASITLPIGLYQGDTRQSYNESGVTLDVIPCPWETRKVPCNQCRLCLRDALPGNPVVGFQVHGNAVADLAVVEHAVEKKRRLAVVR